MSDDYTVKTYEGEPVVFRSLDLNPGGDRKRLVPFTIPADESGEPFGDDNPLPVRAQVQAGVTAATSNVTSVASTASSQQLLPANVARKGVSIANDDEYALRVKFGATASATSYTVAIPSGGFYEMPAPIYTGRIDGIWDVNGSGAARITELT